MRLLWIALLWTPVVSAQDAPEKRRNVRSEVHVRITETVPEERAHDVYRQIHPVEHVTTLRRSGKTLSGKIRYTTDCESPSDDRGPALVFPAGTAAPTAAMMQQDPFQPVDGPPRMEMTQDQPGRTNTTQDLPGRTTMNVRISLRVSTLRISTLGTSSLVNNLDHPPVTGSGSSTPPPPPPPGPSPPPPPPPPPPSTKPSLFGSGGSSDGPSDSDTPFLSGPEFDVVLSHDISGWRPASWLPEGTSLHLLARALFGEFELFDESGGVALYSAGLGLGIPLVQSGSFRLDASVFGGPGFLRSDLGDAVGFSGSAGLRVQQGLTRGLTLFAAAEAELFAGSETTGVGPAFNAGLNLTW